LSKLILHTGLSSDSSSMSAIKYTVLGGKRYFELEYPLYDETHHYLQNGNTEGYF